MTRIIKLTLKTKFWCTAWFCFGLLLSTASPAALINIATAPLANSTTSLVLPNLMYVLDDSGSMGNDFMPDFVNDSNKCKSTAASGAFSAGCTFGDPAYALKEYNTIAYNPAISYLPGLNADGTQKPSMTSANTAGWTVVPTDAFNVQNRDHLGNSVSSISFIPNAANTAGYPDKVWCNISNPTTADLSNPSVCNQNSQYNQNYNQSNQGNNNNQRYNQQNNQRKKIVINKRFRNNNNLHTPHQHQSQSQLQNRQHYHHQYQQKNIQGQQNKNFEFKQFHQILNELQNNKLSFEN